MQRATIARREADGHVLVETLPGTRARRNMANPGHEIVRSDYLIALDARL
jgi:hypothetical protein